MTEREQLLALCVRLGAPPAQAATLADQLRKRCDQLVAERGWPRVRAMEHLLTLLVRGSAGETAPGFEGGRAPSPAPSPDQADPPPARPE
jgi:hypothetical protein